jgi:hypothetical protein
MCWKGAPLYKGIQVIESTNEWDLTLKKDLSSMCDVNYIWFHPFST